MTVMNGGDWDAQAVPLLNGTIFNATYLVRGKIDIEMPSNTEYSLI